MPPPLRHVLHSLAALMRHAPRLHGAILISLCSLMLYAAPGQAQLGSIGDAAAAEPTSEVAAADPTNVADALRLLAVVLEDPEARSVLVEQLRAAEPAAPAATEEAGPDIVFDLPVPRILAGQTREMAEEVGDHVRGLFGELLAIGEITTLARGFDFRAAWDDILPVLLVALVVLAAVWLIRLALRPTLRRFEGSVAAAETALAPLRWKLAGLLVETIPVIGAWAIGYGLALLLGNGTMPMEQTLFLNAFLVVGASRILLRTVFRPRHSQLRLIRMRDATARHWTFWLGRIIGIIGYGTLFAAPLAAFLGAPRLASWLMLAVVIVAMMLAITLVVRNREVVRAGLEDRLRYAKVDVIVAWLYPLAHYWHLIAIGYILALFVVWRAVPGEAVGFMIRATLSSVVVILAGSLLIALISRSIRDGITLNPEVRAKFPTLEIRLNRFVPAALQVLRFVSAAIVVASILTFWGIVDAPAWLGSPGGQAITWSFLWISTILVLAGAFYIVVASWVEYRLNPDVGSAPSPRERTLLALFSNAFVIVLGIITAMTVLTEVGINIAPLLAGAGVVGLAIGFGAQKLVQDIINGAFIQFENTMNEGDVVTAGGVTGVVEKLTIRSVSLRDLNGHYHMIPFSGVDTVTNFMKGFSFHVAEIDVAYRENISDVKAALFEAFERLMQTEHRANILPPLEMQGIVAFRDSGITVRARIKTLPGQQWAAGRAYSELIKEVFDERDIEIPFPHRTLYMGVDKAGDAPPLHLHTLPREGRARRDAPPAASPAGEGLSRQPPDDLAPPADAELTPPAPEDV